MVVICKTNISRSCRQQFVKTLWGIDNFFPPISNQNMCKFTKKVLQGSKH